MWPAPTMRPQATFWRKPQGSPTSSNAVLLWKLRVYGCKLGAGLRPSRLCSASFLSPVRAAAAPAEGGCPVSPAAQAERARRSHCQGQVGGLSDQTSEPREACGFLGGSREGRHLPPKTVVRRPRPSGHLLMVSGELLLRIPELRELLLRGLLRPGHSGSTQGDPDVQGTRLEIPLAIINARGRVGGAGDTAEQPHEQGSS